MTRQTIFFLIVVIVIITPASAAEDHHHAECSRPYRCGELENIEYPFWGGENRPDYCGYPGFELECVDNQYSVITISNQRFRVTVINQSRLTIRLARLDLWDNVCPERFENTTAFYGTPFRVRSLAQNFSIFYGCPADVKLPAPNNFTCTVNGSRCTNFYGDQAFMTTNPSNLSRCSVRIDVLLRRASLEALYSGSMALKDALNDGFDAEYVVTEDAMCDACRASGGICGWNSTWTQFSCLCLDGPRPALCPSSSSSGTYE